MNAGQAERGDCDLEHRIPPDHNVFGFKIAVYHPICVEVLEAIELISQGLLE